MTQTPGAGREPYGHDLARAERDYPDYAIYGTRTGLYGARLRGQGGGLIGDVLTAQTLDGLAERMDAGRRRIDGA